MSSGAQSRHIDVLFKTLGTWGRYQILQMALVKSLTWPACYQLYIYMYLGYQPPMRCKSVLNASSELHPIQDYHNDTLDTIDIRYHNKCPDLVDFNNGTITTGTCQSGYDFKAYKESTLITQWDLVCELSYQAQLTQTALVIGQGVGATFFTILADRYGRKKVCLFSQWMMLFVSLATSFSPNIFVFTGLRFILGCVQQGLVMSVHVMPLEVLPTNWRAMIHLFGGLLWTVFLTSLCGLAFAFQDYSWRYFQLTTVTVSVITLIPNMMFLDESLRWLLANGRVEEARKIIEKATKMNGIDPVNIKEVVEDCLQESAESKKAKKALAQETGIKVKRYTVLDIFRHRKLRTTAFIMWFAWIVNAGTSFGLALTAGKMSGDRFINYFLISIVNLPAGIISYITMQRIGRKFTAIISHIIAGIALVCAAVINAYIGRSTWVTAITMIGKFGISMSWGTLFQYTPELFPTNLRSVGLGISSSSARIGGMLAPFAAIVMDYYPWLPGALYGGTCLLVAGLMFMLTETVDKELPQTIDEIKSWTGKKQPKKSDTETMMKNG